MPQEFLWNQIVDTIDDYFRIDREHRVQQIGDIVTEGRVDTFPVIGSTLLEPWQRDSTPGFERLHSTLQTIRRQATVQVTPQPSGYLIYVAVAKELEAVDQPEHATVGASTSRFHDSLNSPLKRQRRSRARTLGWISIGRDTKLEQRIIEELCGRLIDPSGTAPVSQGH